MGRRRRGGVCRSLFPSAFQTSGFVRGCSAPTWEVRGGARQPPRRSPRQQEQPQLRRAPSLDCSLGPLACAEHTQARGGRGGGGGRGRNSERRGGGGRELRTVRRSRLQSQGFPAGRETSRLPPLPLLLGGQRGSPPSAGRTGARRRWPRRRGGPNPSRLRGKRRRERARSRYVSGE